MAVPLSPNECYFDVKALFAGLTVVAPCALADDVRAEQILENNLVAQSAQIAKEVLLGMPSDADAPVRPVGGIAYRVRGHRLFAVPDDRLSEVSRSNDAAIAGPKDAFRRAMVLLYAVDLVEAGTFVTEVDNLDNRRVHSYQFNTSTLSVHYEAACVWDGNADELQRMYAALTHDYLATGDGKPLVVAIDRLGRGSFRADAIDANLDLCIAAEIAFLFGVKLRGVENEMIAETVRENARAFFGDGEFFWGRDEVAEILRDSYRERSATVHGRKFGDAQRLADLTGYNVRLREVLKAALRTYVERRPARLAARAAWPARRAALERGEPLPPIFT